MPRGSIGSAAPVFETERSADGTVEVGVAVGVAVLVGVDVAVGVKVGVGVIVGV